MDPDTCPPRRNMYQYGAQYTPSLTRHRVEHRKAPQQVRVELILYITQQKHQQAEPQDRDRSSESPR